MKLKYFKENVVDFQKYKDAKNAKGGKEKTPTDKSISVDVDLDNLGFSDETVKDNLDLLLDWIREYRKSFKMPKFDGLDYVFDYLTVELNMPYEEPQKLKSWYKSLTPVDRNNVDMITNTSDRILNNIDKVKRETKKFVNSIPQNKTVPDVVNMIYDNLESDEDILKQLSGIYS